MAWGPLVTAGSIADEPVCFGKHFARESLRK
jgi:hypothetical protein